MQISITFIFSSLIYTLLVFIVYLSKERLKSVENKIYRVLISLNVTGLILELLCCFFVWNRNVNQIYELYNVIFNRLFLIFNVTWILTFTMYVIYISFNENERFINILKTYKKKIITFAVTIYLLLLFLINYLPLYFYSSAKYIYSYGPATNIIVILGVISIIIDIYCIIMSFKKIKEKKYYPLLLFVFVMIISAIVRSIDPGFTVINSLFAFIAVLMYFTIENPDLNLIKELYSSKEIAEKANANKSSFLYNVVQRIRNPLNNIKKIGNEALEIDKKDSLKEGISIMMEESNRLESIINDVLDISDIESKEIKIYSTSYNPHLVINQISSQFNLELKDKCVEFRKNITRDLPSSLYGDSIKLKQIINTILYNSLKYTNKGFIELRVSHIIKHNICRVVITVEDSGIGMSLDKTNKILEKAEEVNLKKLNDKNMNLAIVKKLVNYIGGNILIKSEVNKGTEITIVLDQIINEKKQSETEKRRNKDYNKTFADLKKVLVIDEDSRIIKTLEKNTKSKDISYIHANGGQIGLEKIRENNNYEMIIMSDDLSKIGYVNTLNKLKTLEEFKNPIIVMTNNTKNDFISLGFDSILKKPIEKIELNKIIEKYLSDK